MTLDEMRKVDIRTVDPATLHDRRDVRIDSRQPREKRMLPQKISELLVEATAKLTGRNREEQALIFCRAEHPIGTLLQAAVIVLKRKIQHRSFTDGIIPKRGAGADMIGKLGHQEALAQLRSADKKVSTPVEQTVHKGRLALIHIVQQLRH